MSQAPGLGIQEIHGLEALAALMFMSSLLEIRSERDQIPGRDIGATLRTSCWKTPTCCDSRRSDSPMRCASASRAWWSSARSSASAAYPDLKFWSARKSRAKRR